MRAVTLRVDEVSRLPALQRGTPDFLTPMEIDLCTGPPGLNRAWDYRCQGAGEGL